MHSDLLDLNHPLFWTVPGLLKPDECAELIGRIDDASPEVATINAPGGHVLNTNVRNNERVIFDDSGLASLLWDRVHSHVPDPLLGMSPVGANERLRCYRYSPGHKFGPHYDGSFARDETERSLLTFMVYLNEGFEGGETRFLELGETIVPKTGLALLFQHPILHEGSKVLSGTKYAIRSDVMYRTT